MAFIRSAHLSECGRAYFGRIACGLAIDHLALRVSFVNNFHVSRYVAEVSGKDRATDR